MAAGIESSCYLWRSSGPSAAVPKATHAAGKRLAAAMKLPWFGVSLLAVYSSAGKRLSVEPNPMKHPIGTWGAGLC